MKFSDQETRLLREIQRDGSLPLAELAERVGMAQSTVWRKLQDFDAAGVIRHRVAVLDPAKVARKLCVFAAVSLHDHSEEALTEFGAMVRRCPEIMECHATSGETDYMLKIRVEDVETYEAFMTHNLLRNRIVRSVVSSFALREIKCTTELPI